jgi:hypothetical protein
LVGVSLKELKKPFHVERAWLKTMQRVHVQTSHFHREIAGAGMSRYRFCSAKFIRRSLLERLKFVKKEPAARLELATSALRKHCSTN